MCRRWIVAIIVVVLGCGAAASGADKGAADPRESMQLTPFELRVDRKHCDCRIALDDAWEIPSPDAMIQMYLGVPKVSAIFVGPLYRGTNFRPVFVPYRLGHAGSYALRTDPTSVIIDDAITNKPAFFALDLSKPGAVDRLATLRQAPYDVFLLATNEQQLNLALFHLRGDRNAASRRGLAVYGFMPAVQKVAGLVDCLVFDSCDLMQIDAQLLADIRRVEIINCDHVDLTGIESGNRMKELVLTDNAYRSLKDLRPVSRMQHLESLDIGGYSTAVADEYLSKVFALRQLKRLRLAFGLSPAFSLAGIERCTELQWLYLSAASMPAAEMSLLRRLPRLRVLELDGTEKAESLPLIESLQVLSIRKAYSVTTIPPLSTMPRLHYADLRETRVRWDSDVPKPPSLKYRLLPSAESNNQRKP